MSNKQRHAAFTLKNPAICYLLFSSKFSVVPMLMLFITGKAVGAIVDLIAVKCVRVVESMIKVCI